MLYSKWLPSLKCWLKALELMIYMSPVVLILKIVIRYFSVYGLPFVNDLIYWTIIFLCFLFILGWLSFSYLFHFFWGKADSHPQHLKWFPSNSSLKEGFIMEIIAIFSSIIMIVLVIPFVPNIEGLIDNPKIYDNFLFFSGLIWLISAAYFYHLRYWIEKKFTKIN